MIVRSIHFILLGMLHISVLILLGCAASSHDFPRVRSPETVADNPSEIARLRAQQWFVKARDYDRRGLEKLALQFYHKAYLLDSTSSALRSILLNKYMQLQRYQSALLLVKSMQRSGELSDSTRRILSRIYLKLGEAERALETLESVSELRDRDLATLILIHRYRGNPGNALRYQRKYTKRHIDELEPNIALGTLLRNNEHYDEAESLFVSLAKRFGKNARILTNLGTTKLAQGDSSAALDFFNTALLIDSTWEEALEKAALLYAQQQRYEKAVSLYERLYQIDSSDTWVIKSLSLMYYYQQQYEKAAGLLERNISDNYTDPGFHYYLGLMYRRLEDFDPALLEIKKTLSFDSTYVPAWLQLIDLLMEIESDTVAREYAIRFTRSCEDRIEPWITLGKVYSSMQQYDSAQAALNTALTIDSSNEDVWFEIGSVYEQGGDIDSAAYAFGRALDIDSQFAVAANYLGYMWAENDMHLDSAASILQLALAQEPENAAFLDSYAWILYKQQNRDAALEYIEKAIMHLEKDRSAPVIWHHYGDILVSNNAPEQALEAYRKSIELGSTQKTRIQEKIDSLLENQSKSASE